MDKAVKEAIRERIWWLENEAKTMRDEAKRLREQIRKPVSVAPPSI